MPASPLGSRVLRAVCLASLFALPEFALAADNHTHAAPNGGQIQKVGKLEGELLVRGSQVTLFMVDDDEKKVDTSAMSATATVLAKGNQQKTIELKPSGDNRLSGVADFAVDGKFRAAVTLRNPAGEIGKARYSLDPK